MTQSESDSRKEDLSTLARGAGISLGGKGVGRVEQAAVQVAMARLLGPASYGLFGLGWTVLGIGALVAPLGLDWGVIRFGSGRARQPGELGSILLQALLATLGSALAFGLLVYLLAPLAAQALFHKPEMLGVLRWIALALVPLVVLRVVAAATRISQRMQYSMGAEDLLQPAAQLVLFLALFAIGWRLAGAMAAVVISFVAAMLLSLFFLARLFGNALRASFGSRSFLPALLRFSLPTSVAALFAQLLVWIDRLFMGFFRPAEEVGVYQAASQVSFILPVIILYAFTAILSPMIADLFRQGERDRLGELYRVSTKWGLYISLPVFLLIVLAPGQVMLAVFGPQFAAGQAALVLLEVGQLVNVGTGSVAPLLVMTGHQNRWVLLSGSFLGLAVAANWLLVPRFGMMGAALSTSLALSGLGISGIVLLKRTLGITPYDRRYLKGIVAAAAGALALFLLKGAAWGPEWLPVLLHGLLVAGTFGGVLLLLGLDAEDRLFLQLLRNQLRRPRPSLSAQKEVAPDGSSPRGPTSD
jgi:O-antigen/teichoic acid export membrane protein